MWILIRCLHQKPVAPGSAVYMYHRYSKCSKISISFLVLLSNKIKAFIKARISKMLVRIADRESTYV